MNNHALFDNRWLPKLKYLLAAADHLYANNFGPGYTDLLRGRFALGRLQVDAKQLHHASVGAATENMRCHLMSVPQQVLLLL